MKEQREARREGARKRNTTDLDFDEVYPGEMNPFKLTTEKRKVFSCNFYNMADYPFGEQWCSFTMVMGSFSNKQTNLILNHLKYEVFKIGQYTIKKWQWEKRTMKSGEKRKAVNVSVLLERKLTNIFLVTYLPTVLMNIINQASNYITGDTKYDLIYTINM